MSRRRPSAGSGRKRAASERSESRSMWWGTRSLPHRSRSGPQNRLKPTDVRKGGADTPAGGEGGRLLEIRYSKEDFGYLIVFPDGSMDLFQESAAGIFDTARSKADFEPHRLDRLKVPPDFHLRRPLIVWFEVTRACDLRCTHCYIDAGKKRANELSTREVFAALDDLAALGAFSLVLAGGEPYLRRDFPEILEYAASLGFVIAIVTNGSLLTPELARR